MERILVQTLDKPQNVWEVAYDTETLKIVDFDTQLLLRNIFKDDPNSIFLLEDTGFSMPAQVQNWIGLYSQTILENGDLEQAKILTVDRVIQDVIGFYFEYLSRQDIFPIPVEFKETENGCKIVYASKYHTNLECVTQNDERDGSLATGINQVVEILKRSDPNTIVILTSPKGWSGLGHGYPDTQTYCYWVNNHGDLNALTIRTDISLPANERLVSTRPTKNVDTKERIKMVVSTPRTIQADSFEKVLDLIENASGQKFNKQREELKQHQQLFTLNDKAEKIVAELKLDLLRNISHLDMDNIRIFVILIGKAILDLRKQVLDDEHRESQKMQRDVYISPRYHNETEMYRQLAWDVSQIAGCNGGGQKNSYVDTSLALGLFSKIDGGAKFVERCGVCNTPIFAFISSGYRCDVCKQIYLGC